MAKETFDMGRLFNVDTSKKISSNQYHESKKVGRKKGEDAVLISVKILKKYLPDFDSLAKFANKTRTQYINDLIEKEIDRQKEVLALFKKLRENTD